MENKKSYYENGSQDMREFNPRFSDLYQEYSDSQHASHTFNLNGIIYVHNHRGGEPIPVGKAKSPASGKSAAMPNRSATQRRQSEAEPAGATQRRRSEAEPAGATRRRQSEAEPAGATRRRQSQAEPAGATRRRRSQAEPAGASRPGAGTAAAWQGNASAPVRPKAYNAARAKIAGAVVLFIIAAIVPIISVLINQGKDADFSKENGGAYDNPDVLERESQPLAQPITEEGVVYLMGGFIRIGAAADTLLESYENINFAPLDPIQPGENYYVTLDVGDKYGVGLITLTNMGDEASKDLKHFKITDVYADAYAEWKGDVYTRTETDCEIIGGITIGMDYTKALWALGEVCDNPEMLNSSEGDKGNLLGYSEKYYYNIAITDDEVSRISVTLQDTETEQ